MELIGTLDSPYVRRTAISLRMLGVPFRHRPLSVFRHVEEFRTVNPLVKAPTLVADDGTVLMDSTLIIAHAEDIAGRSLMPAAPAARVRAWRLIGLALVANEKTVQIVYEHKLRPAEKLHAPWLERVSTQLAAAYAALEAEAARADGDWLVADRPLQPDVAAAVAWGFTRFMHEQVGPLRPEDYPALAALSARAEALPEFRATPISR